MGGILFCALAFVAWLAFDHSRSGFVLAFALLAGAGLGVLDDLANIRGRGALGLLGRQKLALQALVGVLIGIGLLRVGATHQVLPVLGTVDIRGGIVPLAALAVVAASNAVNLTDGVDGLAAWCSVLVFSALWALAWHLGIHAAAVLSAAVVGGVLAFLVYNWHPARVFMGDTGSLALGCLLAAVAAEVHVLWLLPLLGLVFVAETLSVIVNVTAITRFQRRILRASPLHHHFEELGLREQRLVLWFGAAAGLGALLAVLAGLRSGISS
jgi:phospho-N-acetylmuramoyl-pentapeptide-transferase